MKNKRVIIILLLISIIMTTLLGAITPVLGAPHVPKVVDEDGNLVPRDGYDGPIREESGSSGSSEGSGSSEREKPKSIYDDIDNFRYDESMFESLVDMFYDDATFKGYTSNEKMEELIPHALLYGDEKSTKPIETTDRFYKVQSGFAMTEPTSMYSFYLGGGETTWANNTRPRAERYKNLYSAMLAEVDTSQKDKYLHVDAYGNLITNNRQIVSPFFMSTDFTKEVIDNGSFSSEIGDAREDITLIPYVPNEDILQQLLKVADKNSRAEIKVMYINSSGKAVYKEGKVVEIVNWMGSDEGKSAINTEATKEFIKTNYKPLVRDFHNNFIEKVEETEEMDEIPENMRSFLGKTDHGSMTIGSEDSQEKLDGLLENLLVTLLTGGFGELLKLTVAHGVAEAYIEIFIEFSSKYIFHTADYTETNTFMNVMGAYVVLVIVLIMLNLILSIFSLIRGKITFSKVIVRVLLAIVVMTLPIIVYNKVVQKVFNEWPSKIVKEEIRQTMILDRWAIKETEKMGDENIEIDEDGNVKNKLPFVLNKEFRGTQYNYLLKFETTEFVNKSVEDEYREFYGGRTDNEEEALKELSKSKDKRVALYADANHVMSFFQSGEDNLIEYLATNETDNYKSLTGLVPYKEYGMYVEEDGLFDKEVFTDEVVTASELGTKMYEYYENVDYNLYERLLTLSEFILDSGVNNQKREEVLDKLSSVQTVEVQDIYNRLTESDFNTEAEYEQFQKEKNLMEISNYGDITGIYGFLKEVTVVGDSVTNFTDGVAEARYREKEDKLRKIAYEINRATIDEYIDTIINLRGNFQDSTGLDTLESAIEDVTILNMYFNLNNNLANDNFPSDIETSRVESDAYIRSLIIPYRDMKPSNKALENAALYVGTTKSIFTLIFFALMIVILIVYGLIKLVVISKILLPILLILMIWNYIIQEKYENKVLIGAGYIMGVFALVHWGFMGIWKYCVYQMNKSLIGGAIGGRTSFHNTATNSVIILIYFVIVMKYLIYPTLKTAVKNYNDLGGQVVSDRMKERFESVKEKLSETKLGREFGNIPDGMTERGGKRVDRVEELKKDKELADSNKREKTGNDGIGDEIESEINDLKNNEPKTIKEKAFNLIPNNLRDRLGLNDDENIQEKKEKVENLKKKGIFTANSTEYEVDGNASNKVGLKNTALAFAVEKFLKGKGLNTKLDGKNVHIEGTDEDIMEHSEELTKSLEESKKELENVDTYEGETVANAHASGKVMTIAYDKGVENRLKVMKESGLIDDYEVRTENGEKQLVVDANEKGYKEVTEMVESTNRTGLHESIGMSDFETVYTEETEQMIKGMEKEGLVDSYEVITGEDGNKTIKVESGIDGIAKINHELSKADGYASGRTKVASFDYNEESLSDLQELKDSEILSDYKVVTDEAGNKRIDLFADNISDADTQEKISAISNKLDIEELDGFDFSGDMSFEYNEDLESDLKEKGITYSVFRNSEGERTTIEVKHADQDVDKFDKVVETSREYNSYAGNLLENTKQSKMQVGYDTDVEQEIKELMDEGVVENYSVDTNSQGQKVITIDAPDYEYSNIEDIIKTSYKDNIKDTVSTKSIIDVDDNEVTEVIMENLLETGVVKRYTTGDGVNRYEVAENKISSVISDIETSSNDLNDLTGAGLGTQTIRLNANNDIVNSMMLEYSELEGIDYTISDNEYVPLNDDGLSILKDVSKNANKIKAEVIQEYEDTVEIDIRKSREFRDSAKNIGNQHIIDNLAYSEEEVSKVLNDMREETINYTGSDPAKVQNKVLFESINDIRNTTEGLSIYTNKETSKEDVEKLVNNVQRKLNDKEKKSKERKKRPNQERKAPTKTQEEKMVEDILELLRKQGKEDKE